MSAFTFNRRQLLQGAAAAALPFALPGCADKKDGGSEPLIVGGLPVTCNLTLPVACVAKEASLKAGAASNGFRFEYSKYSGWPEIKESLMAGRIQAGYMLAPLVMDLADKKIPVKVVSLGHRSGAVIMVRTESPYEQFSQLRGKRIAIPSRFAVDFLFLRKLLARENMTPADIEIIEMPPPDMPAALYANAVDAYCTGEPFGAAAQRAGYARVLRMTRDHWRNYICCVLTVRQELIDENRPMVQDLVNQIQGAGLWLDQTPENRTKAVQIASGKNFFNQDPKILQFVMDNPDRSRDLRRPAHDPRGIRGSHAAVHRGRHDQASDSVRKVHRRQLRACHEGRVHPAMIRRTLLAMLLGTALARRAEPPRLSPPADLFKAGTLSPVMPAPEFALAGSDGKPFSIARFRGKVVLLAFGFSNCGEVCPITLATLAGARKKLGAEPPTSRWHTSRWIPSATRPRR